MKLVLVHLNSVQSQSKYVKKSAKGNGTSIHINVYEGLSPCLYEYSLKLLSPHL